MDLKLTVLCENSVRDIGPLAEHGWSVLIETIQGKYLFDTGGGLTLEHNSRYYKKDLSGLDGILLSHHHIDHSGGLAAALKLSGATKVYSHPDLFKESFSLRKKEKHFIGLPYTKAYLESLGASWQLDREFKEIAPNIFLSGEVKRETTYEKGDPTLVIEDGSSFSADPLMDDQSLIFKTKSGLVIVLGCAHAGIINTLEHIIEKTGEGRILTLIGGTHLGSVSQEQKEKSLEALGLYDIESIGVSHCTGSDASFKLREIFEERFFHCQVGTELEFKG